MDSKMHCLIFLLSVGCLRAQETTEILLIDSTTSGTNGTSPNFSTTEDLSSTTSTPAEVNSSYKNHSSTTEDYDEELGIEVVLSTTVTPTDSTLTIDVTSSTTDLTPSSDVMSSATDLTPSSDVTSSATDSTPYFEVTSSTQTVSDSIGLASSTQTGSDPIEVTSSTQTVSDSIGLASSTQTGSDPIEVTSSTQTVSDSIGLASSTQTGSNPIEVTSSTQTVSESTTTNDQASTSTTVKEDYLLIPKDTEEPDDNVTKTNTSKTDRKVKSLEPDESIEPTTSTTQPIVVIPTVQPNISTTRIVPIRIVPVMTFSNATTTPHTPQKRTEHPTTDEITDFVLKFEGRCNEDNSNKRLSHNSFVIYDRDLVNEKLDCMRVVRIQFHYNEGSDLSDSESTLEALNHLVGKLEVSLEPGHPLKLSEVVALTGPDAGNNSSTNTSHAVDTFFGGLSYGEFVSYLVIGICFGCLILFAFILLCAKCCKSERRKRSHLRDIPQITLRMEDYNLTRIPRPTTIYSTEGSKGPIYDTATHVKGKPEEDAARMSNAYDTAIIPLDDYDGDMRRYTNNHRYNGAELRTFGNRGGTGTRTRSVNMEEPGNRGSVNSTERLTPEYYLRKRDQGLENPIYH